MALEARIAAFPDRSVHTSQPLAAKAGGRAGGASGGVMDFKKP